MSDQSPVSQLDMTNAPFSEEQREWLQQLAQWIKPLPVRGDDQQVEDPAGSGAPQSESSAKQTPGEDIASVRIGVSGKCTIVVRRLGH